MSDIVERLRTFEQLGELHPVDDDPRITALMNEAADEIERLEEQFTGHIRRTGRKTA